MEVKQLSLNVPKEKRRRRHELIQEAVKFGQLINANFIGFWGYVRVYEHKHTRERVYARWVGSVWVYPKSGIKVNCLFDHFEQFFPCEPPSDDEIMIPVKWLVR